MRRRTHIAEWSGGAKWRAGPATGAAFTLIGLILTGAAGTGAVAAQSVADGIGVAAHIKQKVTGQLFEDKRHLAKGDAVFQNEALETGAKAQAEFILKDDTRLALGPNSRLRLDKFIYNPDKKTGDIILNAAAGSFRFITGLASKTAYKINTPVATIGVRGTVFDGFVNDKGEVAILLIDGEVDVCTSKCRRVKRKGYFVRVMQGGIFKGPHLWDKGLFNGVGLARAFPFVGKRLIIDPVRRLNPARLLRKAAIAPGRLLKQGARSGRKITRSTRQGVRNLGRKTGRAIRRLKPFR